jgi:hypothetical protein
MQHLTWHTLNDGNECTLNHAPQYMLDDAAFRATAKVGRVRKGDVLVLEVCLDHMPGGFAPSFHLVTVTKVMSQYLLYTSNGQSFFIDLTRKGHVVKRADYLRTLAARG